MADFYTDLSAVATLSFNRLNPRLPATLRDFFWLPIGHTPPLV
jgi:hypothetical protein